MSVHAQPVLPDRGPVVVFVGGVPGAGKSTALRAVGARGGVRVLDPEQVAARLAVRLHPLPYRVYRPLVHLLQALRVLLALLADRRGAPPLLVHDTATRPWLRHLGAAVARRAGWRPVLVLIDVPAEAALAGQLARGRVLPPRRNARHWRRWLRLRSQVRGLAAGSPHGAWEQVRLCDRETAAALLDDLARPDMWKPLSTG
ncbi:AAA family ATPase [Auraticoccus sp. F435]|uniref:AAA family ATPase n=1 Tax=Auraticoccus cholistanensis TaxID=2656650 RepID=A0A6A9UWN9_9ACTN|nr:AAA family ATPase [Auraticoccus cholistanensis]MVA75627.1 AAA family ATPase [Auraticoccus cholistanensis]